MSLFRIWPFRVLLATVVVLVIADLVVITTSGRPSTSTALHVVIKGDYPPPAERADAQERRDLKRASRSSNRIAHPQVHPLVVHVTCWNGKVVVDRPGVQDCPSRPVARPHEAEATIGGPSATWAHTRKSIGVANCESGPGPDAPRYDRYVGDPHLRDPNGHYGKWQFSPSTAVSVGAPGAGIADLPEAQQDFFAWKLWLRDGWGQWECASMV